MRGIVDYSVYLPAHYIKGNTILKNWNIVGNIYNRTVGYFDEDALTMGVESCKRITDKHKDIDGLFFCSASSPINYKNVSAYIGDTLNFNKGLLSMDITGNFRSGVTALLLSNKINGNIIIATSENPELEHGSSEESIFGDGAVSLLVGEDNLIAEIIDTQSDTEEFPSHFKRSEDAYIISNFDKKYTNDYGFNRIVKKNVEKFLLKNNLKAEEIDFLIVNDESYKNIIGLCKILDFDKKSIKCNEVMNFTGSLGNAQPMLAIVNALENAEPGNKVLVVGYGDGCDIVLLRVTKNINNIDRTLNTKIKELVEIDDYVTYIKYKRGIKGLKRLEEGFTSYQQKIREKDKFVKLIAAQCEKCGNIITLDNIACNKCGNVENFVDFKLSRTGTVFTYTQEFYYPSLNPPTDMVVINLDGGGRLLCQLTDNESNKLEVGARVELTFRRLSDAGKYPQYYWKAKLIKGGC